MTTTAQCYATAHELVERLGDVERLDQPAKVIGKFVRGNIPAGPVKDASAASRWATRCTRC